MSDRKPDAWVLRAGRACADYVLGEASIGRPNTLPLNGDATITRIIQREHEAAGWEALREACDGNADVLVELSGALLDFAKHSPRSYAEPLRKYSLAARKLSASLCAALARVEENR